MGWLVSHTAVQVSYLLLSNFRENGEGPWIAADQPKVQPIVSLDEMADPSVGGVLGGRCYCRALVRYCVLLAYSTYFNRKLLGSSVDTAVSRLAP